MIGTSRIYLGVHYPSDIIGGYFASGFWLSSAIWFSQRYKERRSGRKAFIAERWIIGIYQGFFHSLKTLKGY